MALQDYLAEEVGEDWVDGIISRRDALRRLALLGFTATTAAALLAACAQAAQTPVPVPPGPTSPPASTATAGPTPAPTPSATATSSPAATTSPASTPGATPTAGPGGAAGTAITFPGPRGELQGFFAPAASPLGAMLVIHENRGLNDHIRSVASRLAADGYSSLAIDLLSEEGGSAAVGAANVPAALSRTSLDRLVSDMKAGIDELERRVPGAKIGITGFCFGGGMVWALLDAGEPRLSAAIPFYGPAPSQPDFAGNKAAVLGIYAELDARVNATSAAATAALQSAGLTHSIKTYAGVDHAFFNDTGPRYNAEQAAAAYADVLAWLGTYLAG